MTDTTDVKALRERMMQHREAALTGNTPSFEDCELLVCDLLRALTLSNKQLEAERQRVDELKINWDAAKKSIQFYKSEIADLKGDQVPVAYTAARWLDTRCKLSVWTDRESAVMEIGDNSKVAELYDRPQKLVVLPPVEKWRKPDEVRAQNAYRILVQKEIDAAGGIVKDGE